MKVSFDPIDVRDRYEGLDDNENPVVGISDDALAIATDQVNLDYFWEAYDFTVSAIVDHAKTVQAALDAKAVEGEP
jgi:hypothetical protein